MTLEEICSRIEAFIGAPEASLSTDIWRAKVFRFQFEHNEPYRRFCESRAVYSHHFDSWKKFLQLSRVRSRIWSFRAFARIAH
jgi:hypothetical protein